ncbi:MAG TPA: hypothetical protein VE781_17750 [Kineosporiaceae bacterium]|nr:hypothetical protein [Kineosporiaceae bacterium]
MNPDLEDLLDDAAVHALAGRTLDARALLAAGRARHRRTLLGRGAAGLAVAAVLVLGLLLAPLRWVTPAVPATPAPSASTPVGLPRSLPLPTPWTPTVAAAPIERASLLLHLREPDSDWGDDAVTLVLSADGTSYRRLPDGMSSTYLTDDGRSVVSVALGLDPSHVSVHLLRLADGRDRVVPLPDGGRSATVKRVVLTPDSRTAYVVGTLVEPEASDGSQGTDATWVVDIATGRVDTSALRPYLVTRTGTLYGEPGGRDSRLPQLPRPFVDPDFGYPVSSPDGRRLARYTALIGVPVTNTDDGFGFVVGDASGRDVVRIPAGHGKAGGFNGTVVLGWLPEGVAVRVGHDLRLFDPATRRDALVVAPAQPDPADDTRDRSFEVYDLAYDVVSSGTRVTGVTQQDEPPWVVRLVRSPSGVRPGAVVALTLLVVALTTLLAARRRRVP